MDEKSLSEAFESALLNAQDTVDDQRSIAEEISEFFKASL